MLAANREADERCSNRFFLLPRGSLSFQSVRILEYGLAFKTHRHVYHSVLGSRVIKRRKRIR